MIDLQAACKELARCTSLGHVTIRDVKFSEKVDFVRKPKCGFLNYQISPPSSFYGQARFTNQWKDQEFQKIGPIFFLPAMEEVHIKSDCQHHLSVTSFYSPSSIDKWFEGDLKWSDAHFRGSLDIRQPTLSQLLQRLTRELTDPGFAADDLIDLINAEILIELARYFHGIEERPVAGGLSPWRLRLIEDRVAQPGHRPTLKELAKLCGLSPRHLTRAFRESKGLSIGKYIADVRMESAQDLLAKGENIKTVADVLGFKSESNFYATFRRATGQSPAEFRKACGRIHIRQ